jgi:hypothetical protein
MGIQFMVTGATNIVVHKIAPAIACNTRQQDQRGRLPSPLDADPLP